MTIDMEFDFEEATKKMDIFSQEDFNKFKESTRNIESSKCVPKDLSDKQLLLFYNACYGDIEKAKICVEKFYMHRKNAPEIFLDRSLESEEMKQCSEVLEFSFLPEKSVEGYDIIFHRLHNTEPSKYCLEHGCKLLFMCVDACLAKRGPQNGYIFLFDMRGVRLGHITRLSFSTLRKFFTYVQESMPVRMRAVHVLNTEPVLDKLMVVIKPFMDKKLYDLIKFHNKNEDLASFYETVIPRSALPPDYGGTLPDTQTLHKKFLQQVRALDPFFKAEEAQRVAAMPDKKRDKDVEQTFKKLDID